MELVRDIETLVNDLLDGELFLVEVSVKGSNPQRIKIIIDSDAQLDVATCAQLSKQISRHLDEENWIDEPYALEVSSPGVGSPLKFKRQYLKNIGRDVEVVASDRCVTGELLEVGTSAITVKEEVPGKANGTGSGRKKHYRDTEISFDVIQKTKVLISFKK